jgi:hypothetical protein
MNINLETLPKSMRGLVKDERGYPVPFFVDYVNGKPEFRAMDPRKYLRCVKEKRCWVCGAKLGVLMCFVVGPMCGINRISAEPPSHEDCGRWSALNCPFMANPRMVRREDDLVNNAKIVEHSAGTAITRNPGVTLLWLTRNYELINDVRGRPLIIMGEPEKTEWYAEGRPATIDEVTKSIDTGIVTLHAEAKKEPGGLEALNRELELFRRYLPV